MKFSGSIVLLATAVSTASASMTVSNKAASKVLRAARKLDGQEEDEYAYLSSYSLKLVGCKAGETVTNAENGETEYSAAIFRLCPTESGCSDTSACGSGYGDYVVGLTSFVEAYFEDQKDNMNWDDNFEVDRYAKCEQYKVENNQDNGENQYADMAFYIGPSCTSDGKDVALAVFEDETCTYASEVAFESLSNGWSLPFSEGGMVTTNCMSCQDYNDNGEAEIREMCQELTSFATSKCEEKMETFSSAGQVVDGCEYISELMPAQMSSSKGKGGKIFGWFVFIAVVVGLAAYVVWWRKKKSAAASNGLSA